MRSALFALAFAVAAPAFASPQSEALAAYEECLARRKLDPKLICMKPEIFDTKPPSAIQLVMPRNAAVKKDVETTGDHLEDATKRAR